jgi:hypothetical protein
MRHPSLLQQPQRHHTQPRIRDGARHGIRVVKGRGLALVACPRPLQAPPVEAAEDGAAAARELAVHIALVHARKFQVAPPRDENILRNTDE